MYSEEYAAIALSRVPAIGPKLFRALVSHFGSPAAVLAASPRDLSQVEGVAEKTVAHFDGNRHLREAEAILRFNQTNDVSTLAVSGPEYPPVLRAFPTAPAVLYLVGTVELTMDRTVAIVGTRKISAAGHEQVERLIDPLADYGALVISGLAYGVDVAAHRRCLQSGVPTLAVMGSGLQHIYPAAHRTVARRISEQGGGLLTEYPPWQGPEREHFPARNRIVAMLSAMTVVVESNTTGGSMITANMAHTYGRKVGACPGRPGDPHTAGCNALIRSGKAHLVEHAGDIVDLLGWKERQQREAQLRLFTDLNAHERALVDFLCTAPQSSVDDLHHQLGHSPTQLAGMLLALEMQGVITTLPGRRYRLSAS